MGKILDEIKYDLSFLRTHTLQPKWFKILKIFILIGILVGYSILFGFVKMAVFFISFVLLMTVVHFIYRVKTNKFTTNWLDFIVVIEDGEQKKRRIGKYYYPAIILNVLISFTLSQILI
jgi:hypothetical protein